LVPGGIVGEEAGVEIEVGGELIPAGFNFDVDDGWFLGTEINELLKQLAADALRAAGLGDNHFPNGDPGFIYTTVNKA